MTYKSGFSLVELSIVLVILGLLVGGVMSGQSLIKAAELRSVTSEFQQYQTAVNVFKDKYFQLPGDFDNATAFWTADSGCGTGGAGSNTEPGYLGGDAMDGTCNGDGDGNIGNGWSATADRYEWFLFWHHLQLAGVISGNYTGVRGSDGTPHHALGENAPRAKFNNGGWTAWFENATSQTNRFNMNYGNNFTFGAQVTSLTHNPLLTPEEAWNIDMKADDGLPAKGDIIAWHPTTCTTAANANDFDGEYDLSDSAVRCALFFKNAF